MAAEPEAGGRADTSREAVLPVPKAVPACVHCGGMLFRVAVDVVGLVATLEVTADADVVDAKVMDLEAPDPGQVLWSYCLGCGIDLGEVGDEMVTAVEDAVVERFGG